MTDYQSIGFTKKTQGIKGELRLKIEDQYMEDFAQVKVVFLSIDGRKIPFFIETVHFDNPFTIKFEDHDSRETATPLTGKEIFLRASDILAEEDRTIKVIGLFYEKYIGYQIADQTIGLIGTIAAIEEYPQQEMAVLSYEEKEVLIPLNEHLIIEIMEKTKTILMDLPEGMLGLEE